MNAAIERRPWKRKKKAGPMLVFSCIGARAEASQGYMELYGNDFIRHLLAGDNIKHVRYLAHGFLSHELKKFQTSATN